MNSSAFWARTKEVFAQALEHPPGAREEFVRTACGADQEMLQHVLRLLAGHDHAGGDLSQPLFPLLTAEIPEQPPRFLPDTVLARRFRVVRLVARGGMGDVYEAEDLELHTRVALKAIRPDIAADERVLELFRNEIQTARRVTHPNVCRIYDLVQHSEPSSHGEEMMVLLTMELLSGDTLSQHLKVHGVLSREQALPLIAQMASALQAAHEAGVIHRDFKPGNVILSGGPGGELKATVTDFGLAIVRGQSQKQALPSPAGGTPAYMAPEQVAGGEATPATDVYALALVISEMVGGRVQGSAPPSLGLPPALRRWGPILRRCLEHDPAKRFSRPAEVAAKLAADDSGRSGLAWLRRRPIAIGLLIAALGLTALIAQRRGLWNQGNQVVYRKLGADDPKIGLWRPSPDGRFFAMTDWNTGNLGLRDIRTGEVRMLTSRSKDPADAQALDAVFSPDGTRIGYSWFQPSGTQLRIIDTRSGEDTLLYEDPALQYCDVEDWSPDGARVLARFDWEDASQMAVISVADRSVLSPQPKGSYGAMVFAPDSVHVIFSGPQSKQGLESDIFQTSIYGGSPSILIKDPADDNILGFSPEGSRLLFSSDRAGTYGIWSVGFSGDAVRGEPTAIAHDLGRASPLGLTRDGTLYYTIATNSQDVYTAEIDPTGARLVSGPENVVKRFRGSFRFPSWSGDGKQIAFVSILEKRQRLWIYNRDSGEMRRVDPKMAGFQRPQWDPSGDRIFVTGTDRSGMRGIFAIDAATGDSRLVIDGKSLRGSEGIWARDGRTLFDRSTDQPALFRLDVQSGRRQVIFVPPAGADLNLENLALSPDEQTLALQLRHHAEGTSSLMVIPATGGTARELLTVAAPEAFLFGSFAWTADSQQILVSRTKGEGSQLWLVPVAGGNARQIEFPQMRVFQMRMNPDGRTIVFAAGGAPSGEVWAAENLVPRE